MQSTKLNKLIDQFLESVQTDTQFFNDVFFGTVSSKVYSGLGTFKTMKSFKDFILNYHSRLFILVGDGGTDDYNTTYGSVPLVFMYFRHMENAIRFCNMFNINTIILANNVVVDHSCAITNTNIVISSSTRKKITLNTPRAFYVDGNVNLKFDGVVIEGVYNNGNMPSLIGFKANSACNLNLMFKDCIIKNSEGNVQTFYTTGNQSLTGFAGFINVHMYNTNWIRNNVASNYAFNRVYPVKSSCWSFSEFGTKIYDELTGVEYADTDPQYCIVEPDIAQYNTFGIRHIPTNVLTNNKAIMGLV